MIIKDIVVTHCHIHTVQSKWQQSPQSVAYVNPQTQVFFSYCPAHLSKAKSWGHTPVVILKCHLCPPELLFVCNAGGRSSMQWGVVVPSDWLLSVVQEPIARLHLTACTAESNQWLLLRVSWGRVRSWLIFSGSLKMSKRELGFTRAEFRSGRVASDLDVSLKLCIAQLTKKAKVPYNDWNSCLEEMRCLSVSNHGQYFPVREVNWHDKLCVFAYIIHSAC